MHWIRASTPLRTISKDGSHHVTNEVFNTFICMLCTVLAIIGTVSLLWGAIHHGTERHIIALAIYGAGSILLFTASSLHHGLNGTEAEEHRLRQFDYYAIFLMISSGITPYCVILLRTPLAWAVLAAVWVLAFFGIAVKILRPNISKKITTTLYIIMGWMGVIIAHPIYEKLNWQAVGLLVLGGVFYTVGAGIFMIEKPNPIPGKFGFHEIWHIFVLAGAASHYLLMYLFLLPYSS